MDIKIVDKRLKIDMLQPANEDDAGLDMYACIDKNVIIPRGFSEKISAGIKVAIPKGYLGFLVPRSSTGSLGTHLANVIGIIDSGYRGEVIMNIRNNSNNNRHKIIEPMSRIAQLVIVSHFDYSGINFVDALSETKRGAGGFGSTGK